jgi:hypothetical protein
MTAGLSFAPHKVWKNRKSGYLFTVWAGYYYEEFFSG